MPLYCLNNTLLLSLIMRGYNLFACLDTTIPQKAFITQNLNLDKQMR
jgi:hypothetical protein